MALPNLCEEYATCELIEQDKYRTKPIKMKFMRTAAKYNITKPIKIFYQNLILTQVYRKFKIRERNGSNMFYEWTEG